MTPVVFVGIQPGSTQKSIRTLETWADRLGLKHYGFVNCISDPNKPVNLMSVDWVFVEKCIEGSIPIALGAFAEDVLTSLTEPKDRDKRFFTLPHPSGLNRKLNDRSYVSEVLDRCQDFIVRRDLEMRVTRRMTTDRVIGAVLRTFQGAVNASKDGEYSPEDAFAIGVLTGWLSDPEVKAAFDKMVIEKDLA